MLAVARFNDSKYCSWAHHEWAGIEGVSEKELAHIEQMDPAQFDRKTWLALTFACELVTARFGPVPKKLMRQMRPTTPPRKSRRSRSWPRSWMPRTAAPTPSTPCSRGWTANLPESGIVDEAIMSAAFCAVLPPLLAYFSYASKRSIDEWCAACRLHPEDGCRVHGSRTGAQAARASSQAAARKRKQPARRASRLRKRQSNPRSGGAGRTSARAARRGPQAAARAASNRAAGKKPQRRAIRAGAQQPEQARARRSDDRLRLLPAWGRRCGRVPG